MLPLSTQLRFAHRAFSSVANIGLLGLPNVGKSTIWNALTQTQNAEASNFPFCTIEPNKGSILVRDSLLDRVAEATNCKNIVYPEMGFIDVAGLIAGAHEGKGLGNQFLADLRGADVIAHVVRCFQDRDIVHVDCDGVELDPVKDVTVLQSELMLADLEMLEKRRERSQKRSKSSNLESSDVSEILDASIEILSSGREASNANLMQILLEKGLPIQESQVSNIASSFGMLSKKPVIYVCNVDEDSVLSGNSFSESVKKFLGTLTEDYGFVLLSAAVEETASTFETEEEQLAFLKEYKISSTGLQNIVQEAQRLLNLQCFYTAGPKECKRWNIDCGSTAIKAAGKIHSDFEKGFMSVLACRPDDWIAFNGEDGVNKNGKSQQQGRDYIVQDRDILHFRINRNLVKRT